MLGRACIGMARGTVADGFALNAVFILKGEGDEGTAIDGGNGGCNGKKPPAMDEQLNATVPEGG